LLTAALRLPRRRGRECRCPPVGAPGRPGSRDGRRRFYRGERELMAAVISSSASVLRARMRIGAPR